MKLRNYQLKASEFGQKTKIPYFTIDMGLGKTAIALHMVAKAFAEPNPKVKGVLIIAPQSTIYTTWPDEIKLWQPHLSYTILHGPDKDTNLRRPVKLFIINYHGLPWLYNALWLLFKKTKRLPFNAIICDEASMLKSQKTKRFGIVKRLVEFCKELKIFLGGTPSPNSLLDLWAQYYLLDGGKRLGKAYTAYRSHYFTQDDKDGRIFSIKEGVAPEIHASVADITYRLDSEDHLNLPDRIDNEIMVKMPSTLMTKYKELEKKFFIELEEAKVEAFSAASLSMKLRQFVQGGMYIDGGKSYQTIHKLKLEALHDLVESSCGQGILCAIQFRFELDMISKMFPGVPYIAGGVGSKVATEHIRAWNRSEYPLMLCHPASLSHGTNLQFGSYIMLWYGLTWSLEQYLQLNKRLHRLGQTHTVIIHHLLMEGTIDQRVMKALKHKFNTQKEFLDFLKNDRITKGD